MAPATIEFGEPIAPAAQSTSAGKIPAHTPTISTTAATGRHNRGDLPWTPTATAQVIAAPPPAAWASPALRARQ